jgi:YGGT family
MAEVIYTRAYSPLSITVRVVNIVLSIVELLLAVRIVLELLGANAGAPFIAWLYGASGGLVAPFEGAFPSLTLGNGYLIDLSAIFAMIAYAVIAWLVIKLFEFAFSSLGA